MVASTADNLLSELLQLGTWIRTRRDNEQDGVTAGSFLLVQIFHSELSWLHILTAKGFSNEQVHSGLKTIRPQNLN